MEEIQNKLQELKSRFETISKQIDRDKTQQEIREFEVEMSKPDFWNDQQKASGISRQLSEKQKIGKFY